MYSICIVLNVFLSLFLIFLVPLSELDGGPSFLEGLDKFMGVLKEEKEELSNRDETPLPRTDNEALEALRTDQVKTIYVWREFTMMCFYLVVNLVEIMP